VNKALHLIDMTWVKERMKRWNYSPQDATPEMLCAFGQFAGGTPPWERENWIKYTVPYGGRGLIFARASAADDETKRTLGVDETRLIKCYDPPCDNKDAPSAPKRKAEWIAKHQRKPIVIRDPKGRMTPVSSS
jgi:hypothetical protein